ncbi:hypothetical protein ABIF69_003912 [Bradyrhizobium japonicum]
MTKPVGKPDAGKPHVRFDERGEETERATSASPRLSSTLPARESDAADEEAICEAATLVLASSEHEAIAKGNAIHGLAGLGNFSFSDCGERLARLGS